MIKKSLVVFAVLIILVSCVFAQKIKLGIDIAESFSPSQPVTFKVSIFDSDNNIIVGDVDVEIKDESSGTSIRNIVGSGELVTISLEDDARAGLWSISADYEGSVVKEFFNIEANEEVKFEISGDELMIINVGNSRYTKTVDVAIGDAFSQKKVDLGVGEQIKFRLVAPDGSYIIKVTDGKTSFSRADVALTGNVIGILDEDVAKNKGSLTGGLRPNDQGVGEETFYGSIRNKSFVYVFILVVVGAAILLGVERKYRSV